MTGRYINNLDAVRAISIILVMAFHARILAFGWIGVWVFFVLSGFLITRSLIPLRDIGFWRGLKIFYVRRSLRIFPVYMIYVTFFLIFLTFTGNTISPAQYLMVYTYTINLAPLFDISVYGRIFAHLWSLGVEEQYYLAIAPLVLFLVPKSTVRFFASALFLVPIARLLAYNYFQSSGFEHSATLVKALTPLQVDSFMIGGLLAYFENDMRTASRRTILLFSAAIVCLSAVALVVNFVSLDQAGLIVHPIGNLDFSSIDEWRLSVTSFGVPIEPEENGSYVWLYTVLALNSAVLIALILRFGQNIKLGIANRIGRVSYGMYVYHAVMVSAFDVVMRKIGIEKTSLLGLIGFALLVAAAWFVAEISFKFLESPFLKLKGRFETSPTVSSPGSAAAVDGVGIRKA